MNKSLLLLVAGVVAYYLYEKSQVGATNNPNCTGGTVFVNGTCVEPPTTGYTGGGNTQFPCTSGYTNVNGQCIPNPGTDVSSNPIGDLLDALI